uniref:Reverse transcriptase domain-containing protein n=1 Tax=Tanacetum cinerariifolium TaxID=118510 RepID=A0A6L2MY02_TANCI|nr:reverse transcriptase domain-containing protein [Tanacetum cinerariifolium]
MRTLSSSNLIVESFTISKRRNRRRSKQIVEPELRTIVETPINTMADTRTMSVLLQAPTEGYRDAIVIPAILVENFELKVGLLMLVTSSQFYGFERDDPHSQIPPDGNLLNRTARDALTIIENKSKVRTPRNKLVVSKASATTSSYTLAYLPKILTDVVKAMLLQNKTPSPVPVKAIEEVCVTCGGPHPYYECLATDSNTFNASTATGTYNQGEAFAPKTYSYSHDSRTRKPIGCLSGWCFRRCLFESWKVSFLADFVVVDYDVDPRVSLILGRPFLRTARALIDVHDKELTLRVNDEAITFNVGQTSRYSYRYDDESVNRIDVIDITCEEYAQDVLGFSDSSKSGNLTLSSDPIIVTSSPSLTPFEGEDNFKPAVQHQRRVNPKIHEVIKKEVIKFLDAGLIYPIFDSLWVSHIHCVLKKGGMTVVTNENNELIPTRLVTGWCVCIDYQKLNDATYKDHFPLPFMDQMHKRLARNEYYFFLDGFSKYFHIPIDPQDQEKTTFTCPYGTFAYRRMTFGICNAPGTFQRCMMAIFHDMIEETMRVFIDDFSVFRDYFSSCLFHLDKMLKRCEDTNLILNWDKCHFMVKEGIVLGHKISKSGIEVDRAKVDVIAKLPHHTFVKGVRSFFYVTPGAENLATDHLSRLENPHQGNLEKKEINETFPLDTTGMISFHGNSSTLWFVDNANYHAGNFCIERDVVPTKEQIL